MSEKEKIHRRNQLKTLHRAQNGICAGCGQEIGLERDMSTNAPAYPTFDHVHPRRLGGPRSVSNGLLKHHGCNQRRGGRPPNGCDMIWHMGVQARLQATRQERGART